MTRSEFDLFLQAAMGTCAVMIVINLLRYKKRKMSAFLLAGAFVSLGAVFFSLYKQFPQPVVIFFGTLVGGFLIGDMIFRASMEHRKL